MKRQYLLNVSCEIQIGICRQCGFPLSNSYFAVFLLSLWFFETKCGSDNGQNMLVSVIVPFIDVLALLPRRLLKK